MTCSLLLDCFFSLNSPEVISQGKPLKTQNVLDGSRGRSQFCGAWSLSEFNFEKVVLRTKCFNKISEVICCSLLIKCPVTSSFTWEKISPWALMLLPRCKIKATTLLDMNHIKLHIDALKNIPNNAHFFDYPALCIID